MIKYSRLIITGVVLLVIAYFLFNFIVIEVSCSQLTGNSLRVVRDSVEALQKYKSIVKQLNHDSWTKRINAMHKLEKIIRNEEKDIKIRTLLTKKIGNALDNPDADSAEYYHSIGILGEIISAPFLIQESSKEQLTQKIVNKFTDSNNLVRATARDVLKEITPTSLPLVLEKMYKETDFFDNFNITFQLKVARTFREIDKIIGYQKILENEAKGIETKRLETAALLHIYQNLSYYLKNTLTAYPANKKYNVKTLKQIAQKLENEDKLTNKDKNFLVKFVKNTIKEVVQNEKKARKNNYPRVGGNLHFLPIGSKKGLLRKGILGILGIEGGVGSFTHNIEYLLPQVHSVKNLNYIITALETMGIIQESQKPVEFQYTIEGKMMDEVKYIAWLMLGTAPEIKFNHLINFHLDYYGSSEIGRHGLVVHGSKVLDKGVVIITVPTKEKKQGRTDFLFMKLITENFKEIAQTGQYLSYLLQNKKERYKKFINKLKGTYSEFEISKSKFENYIKIRYKRPKDKKRLFKKIDEIPWGKDNMLKLSWIFNATWFEDVPKSSRRQEPRFEASWKETMVEVVLHEAYKYYFEEQFGKGSFAEMLLEKIRSLQL